MSKTTSAAWSRLRSIVSGSAGNLVEWFDWYTYSAAALYFAPRFFPQGNLTAQLLQSAAIFAAGFFARPIGAWLMGRYADRAGRKRALTLSVALMCTGSLIIAATPDATRIGIAAPIVLALARIVQGLALGGEYGASATYMSEVAGREYRGFWSSWNYVTLIGGQLLALIVLIVLQQGLSATQMQTWGWRVPFVVGAALAIIAYKMRQSMEESSIFERQAPASVTERGSTRAMLRLHPREVLLVFGMTAGGSMGFYVYTTYMQKFLTISAGFSKAQATSIAAVTLFVFMLVQPLIGWLSDKTGRKPMLLLAFAGGTGLTWTLMNSIATSRTATRAILWIIVGMLLQSGYTAISAVVKAELFPTSVRTLGVSLPYAVANAVFGGTAEYVALWFKSRGIERGFFVYASVLLAVGLLSSVWMPDTKRHSRIIED